VIAIQTSAPKPGSPVTRHPLLKTIKASTYDYETVSHPGIRLSGGHVDSQQLRQARIDEIAESLRQEPYRMLGNDCLVKAVRFARACKRAGIDARVTVCLGVASARVPRTSRRLALPALHAWGEVDGERIEVSRPLGSEGTLGVVPMHIRPVFRVRF
jgi:hypothetical protein